MPIHEYRCTSDGCAHCRAGFDRLEKLDQPPLDQCPQCGAAVARVIGAPALAMGSAHLMKEKKIADSGFTQYRKIGKGVYEKTAGKGPSIIKGD